VKRCRNSIDVATVGVIDRERWSRALSSTAKLTCVEASDAGHNPVVLWLAYVVDCQKAAVGTSATIGSEVGDVVVSTGPIGLRGASRQQPDGRES